MAKRPASREKRMIQELGTASDAPLDGRPMGDSFLPQLRGIRAIKTFREMRENDAVIGAILMAMDMMLRSVEWEVVPADESPEAEREKEFVESLFEDMSHTYEEFISEVLSFLPYGFSFFEIVMKRRDGLDMDDPKRRSKYDDGRIGIRKLAPRAQWTLERWDMDEDGGVNGFLQNSQKGLVYIPIEKGLLFRTVSSSNDPSGRSVLRNAYKSWYYQSHIQNIEAIAIERELNGLPVGRIPSEYLRATADSDKKKFKNDFADILRDVKLNDQGYIMLPSDLYEDDDGRKTNMRMVEFELVASKGSRDIDTSKVIIRYQQDVSRTVLADFIMLGQNDRGSFALSKSKSDMFMKSMSGYLHIIASVLNRHLLPRVWKVNGLDPATMPTMVPGDIIPVGLDDLGNFIQRIAGAGAPLFPDTDLEDHLRESAGLPKSSPDLNMLGREGDVVDRDDP